MKELTKEWQSGNKRRQATNEWAAHDNVNLRACLPGKGEGMVMRGMI
jgi:hypothetical protein